MPFPFILPTTSAFSFSSSFSCDSHPSLPLNASTRRALVRDTLKKHKRLAPTAQPANLPSVVSCLESYLPYVLALDLGLRRRSLHGQEMRATVRAPPDIEWRPILSSSDSPSSSVPGREPRRVRIADFDHEIAFALSTLAAANTLLARAALHPLYTTTSAPVGTQQRQAAIAAATRHLLGAASMYGYLALRAESSQQQQQQQDQLPPPPPPCADVAPATIRALRSLALAEATLLAVLKDDPYPAVVAQDRNRNDSEWMYKAPDVPKVRAHLFARLCLAAADHAAQALAGAQAGDAALRYLEDLRRTGRAKACRFFGIDAELGGQTGTGIAWLRAGLQELGMASSRAKDATDGGGGSGGGGGGGGLGRLRKEWTERREDRKVEKGAANWGADAGRLEEMRVIEMLEAKWAKQNDTIMSQIIPPTGPLLAQMPSGRDIHAIPTYQPPMLEPAVLEAMRTPPDRSDDAGEHFSSDEETLAEPPGAYPGTWQQGESRSGTLAYY